MCVGGTVRQCYTTSRNPYLLLCTLQFIHRNRVDSTKLVMPLLSQVESTIGQRLKLVQGRHYTLKQRELGESLPPLPSSSPPSLASLLTSLPSFPPHLSPSLQTKLY